MTHRLVYSSQWVCLVVWHHERLARTPQTVGVEIREQVVNAEHGARPSHDHAIQIVIR